MLDLKSKSHYRGEVFLFYNANMFKESYEK